MLATDAVPDMHWTDDCDREAHSQGTSLAISESRGIRGYLIVEIRIPETCALPREANQCTRRGCRTLRLLIPTAYRSNVPFQARFAADGGS